jgi:hypothetical protein
MIIKSKLEQHEKQIGIKRVAKQVLSPLSTCMLIKRKFLQAQTRARKKDIKTGKSNNEYITQTVITPF